MVPDADRSDVHALGLAGGCSQASHSHTVVEGVHEGQRRELAEHRFELCPVYILGIPRSGARGRTVRSRQVLWTYLRRHLYGLGAIAEEEIGGLIVARFDELLQVDGCVAGVADGEQHIRVPLHGLRQLRDIGGSGCLIVRKAG